MPRKPLKNLKQRDVKRDPIITDFGSYLKGLRLQASMSCREVAEGMNLAESTIYNIERGHNYPPNPAALQQWLIVIGFSHKYGEALRLLRKIKKKRLIQYMIRHPSTEDIDRILDAYENNTLDEMDMDLLRMIAPREYTPVDYRPSSDKRDTPDKRNPVKARNERLTEKKRELYRQMARTKYR